MDGVIDGHELRKKPGRSLGHGAHVVGEQEDRRVVVHVEEGNRAAPEHDEGSVTELPEL